MTEPSSQSSAEQGSERKQDANTMAAAATRHEAVTRRNEHLHDSQEQGHPRVRPAVEVNADSFAPLLALVPGLRFMAGLVIAALIILGLYVGRDLLIPLALAALLGFLLDPAVSKLKRWGLPRMAAVLIVVAMTLGALGAAGLYVGNQVTELSAELPTYQNTIRQKLRNLKDYFKGPSVFDGAFKVINTVESEITQPDGSAAKGRAARVQKVEIQEPASKPVQQVLDVIAKLGEPVAMTGIVLLFVILILLDRSDLQDRLIRLMGRNMHMATDALDEASTRIGQYLRMQLIVNLSYGVPMALGLWWIGVPGALLWGALAAVMRFVPYIGPLVSAIFPLTLAFAVDPSWNLLLWTLGLIMVLELISNNIIEPWLYGSSTGLSTLSIILAATFWTALWGPIGLILSTPLTVCLLVLGRYIPALGFFEVLLGSEAALDPPQKLFQRLLGGAVDDAVDVATESIDHALPAKATAQDTAEAVTQFYDEVAIPALKIASRHHIDNATAEHRLRLAVGTAELVDELREHYPAQPSVAESRAVVHCVGMRWDIDAQAAAMLTHTLQLYGVPANHSAYPLPNILTDDDIADWGGYAAVCISSFNPQPQAKLRQLCRRIHQRWPQLKIVIAPWAADETMLQKPSLQSIQADLAANTLNELALRLQVMLQTMDASNPAVDLEKPANEDKRLTALRKSGYLAAGHYEQYRDMAKQACNAFQVPWAHIAWVNEDWVHTPGSLLVDDGGDPSQAGLQRRQSIASYVVAEGEPLVIEDLERDPRFSNMQYLQDQGVRFFAGVPLLDKKAYALGALCILDDEPRKLSDDDLTVLQGMAAYLMKSLDDNHGVPPAPKISSERIEVAIQQVDAQDQEASPPSAHTP